MKTRTTKTSARTAGAVLSRPNPDNPTERVWLARARRWTPNRANAHVYRSEAAARTVALALTRQTHPDATDPAPHFTISPTSKPLHPLRGKLPSTDPTGHTPPPPVPHRHPVLPPTTLTGPSGAPSSGATSSTTREFPGTIPNDTHREARNIAESLLSRYRIAHRGPLERFADSGEVSRKMLALLVQIQADHRTYTPASQEAAHWLAGYVRVRIRLDQGDAIYQWPLSLALAEPARAAVARPRQPTLFA